ncbi:MAG: HAD-IA family hydrolase [Caldilinea sp.]
MVNELVCDALLFDLDGVLIDSSACIVRNWRVWAEPYGIDVAEIMKVAHGVRSVETIRQVAPHLDAEAEAARLAALEMTNADSVVAMPGAHALLAALPADAWAIVTSGGADLAKARLRAVGLPIPTTMVTADDVTRGKPAPEPYLLAAKRLGVSPDRCLVVEDAPAGIQAGRAAGIRVLGISSTHTRAALLEQGVTALVDRLAELAVVNSGADSRLRLWW